MASFSSPGPQTGQRFDMPQLNNIPCYCFKKFRKKGKERKDGIIIVAQQIVFGDVEFLLTR